MVAPSEAGGAAEALAPPRWRLTGGAGIVGGAPEHVPVPPPRVRGRSAESGAESGAAGEQHEPSEAGGMEAPREAGGAAEAQAPPGWRLTGAAGIVGGAPEQEPEPPPRERGRGAESGADEESQRVGAELSTAAAGSVSTDGGDASPCRGGASCSSCRLLA